MKKNYLIEAVLAILLIVLYVLHFSSPKAPAATADAAVSAAPKASLIDSQIAYVEIDSIIPNYQMYIDLMTELQAKQNAKEAELNTKAQKFQKDVADFQNKAQKGLETRAKLEEMGQALAEREQQLAQTQQQYTLEIQEEAQVINRKVLQSIMDYLEGWNANHHFHYVFGNSFGGMLLLAEKGLDVTTEVLEGLNKAYTPAQ